MADPSRNAAIYYADDGFLPETAGINGRRVAGASFLAGFMRHAEVDHFVSASVTSISAQNFAEALKQSGRTEPHLRVLRHRVDKAAPVTTLFYPAANIVDDCWRRQPHGATAYGICGITHTTATTAIMRGLTELRSAPQFGWDAIICTSRAVKASVARNIEVVDEHLKSRFGQVPDLPLLPVIPLGIDTQAFRPSPALRAEFRQRHGWDERDVALLTLARLSPGGKFDPGPYFLAVQMAQQRLAKEKPGLRLHVVACGIYLTKHCRPSFEALAAELMPDVDFLHLNGADAKLRSEALAGCDIFAFPIDNIQETFGLAPVEAMAAGLPVIASDWDGLRDTVDPSCGILVPTRTVSSPASQIEADLYFSEVQGYDGYLSNVSALTVIDVPAMAEAIQLLAQDPSLRRRMGEAGQRRAEAEFDWRGIIPRYQDLWHEMTQIRLAAIERSFQPSRANPVAIAPMDLFARYPSHPPGLSGRIVPESHASIPLLERIYRARGYDRGGRPFEALPVLVQIFQPILEAGEAGTGLRDLSKKLGFNPLTIERSAAFFLKYNLVRMI